MRRLLPKILLAIAGWILLAQPVWGQAVSFDPGTPEFYVVEQVEEEAPPVSTPVVDFSVPESPPPAPPPVAYRPSRPAAPVPPPNPAPAPAPPPIFAGGSDSLVARAVGSAEGTRTPDGGKTRAYEGHTDPGNGVWNLGSFSFQHCREAQYNCSTPEQADVHQLRRLEGQAAQLRQRAAQAGTQMDLREELNGIDLANQAPLAALGPAPAYPEHLARAKQQGLRGNQAILESRVQSFYNPATGRLEAGGLGNSEANVRHDQNRRMEEIERSLDVYQQQHAEDVANQIIYQENVNL